MKREKKKAENGSRTHNLRFTKPLLCQLSYLGVINPNYFIIFKVKGQLKAGVNVLCYNTKKGDL